MPVRSVHSLFHTFLLRVCCLPRPGLRRDKWHEVPAFGTLYRRSWTFGTSLQTVQKQVTAVAAAVWEGFLEKLVLGWLLQPAGRKGRSRQVAGGGCEGTSGVSSNSS